MDNKRVYLDKESLTQEKLQEYINFLYSKDYKNILSLFNEICEKREILSISDKKIETENKVVDLQNEIVIYKFKNPIYFENFEEFEENIYDYYNKLYESGIFNFDIPDEYTILQIKENSYCKEMGLIKNNMIYINESKFNKALVLKNGKKQIYNFASKIIVDDTVEGKKLFFPVTKIIREKKYLQDREKLFSLFGYLIEFKNNKFFIFDKEIKISKSLLSMLIYDVVELEKSGKIFIKDYDRFLKLIEEQKITFDNKFIINKIIEEENLRSNLEYYRHNVNDTNLGLWSIYEWRKYPAKNRKKVMLNDSIYGINPLENIDKDSQVFIEIDDKKIRVLIYSSDEKIYPKSIMSDKKKNIYENIGLIRFENIEKFYETYNSLENRPYISKKDFLISNEAYEKFILSKDKNNFYWIDLKNIENNKIKLKDDKKLNLMEIIAYNIGLYLNNEIDKKIYLKYTLSFKNSRTKEQLDFIKESFEKGIRKSIPKSVLESSSGKYFKVEYKVESNIQLLASLLTEKKLAGEIFSKNCETLNYLVYSMQNSEFNYSIGKYSKVHDSERYDVNIEKISSNGLMGIFLEKSEKEKMSRILEESIKLISSDIENNREQLEGRLNIFLKTSDDFLKKLEERLKKELQKINIDFRIFNVKDIEKELLEEINLPENYATAYGMYLCRTAGNIKLYKEKIIDEEEFLYKVGVKKGKEIKVLLDKNSKDEWVKVADASEKDTEIYYINKIEERKFILLSIDRTYENAGVFIKKREKDTIDYTVFNVEGKQLEKVKTEILDFKLEEDF